MKVFEYITETILDFPDRVEELTWYTYSTHWVIRLRDCEVFDDREKLGDTIYNPEVYIGQLMFLNLIERFLEK